MTEPSQYFKGRTVQEQMNEVVGYVDTRAAEVATDAIASDVAQVHQDMLDADADASAAAASAAAAAGTLANAVKKTGEASQNIAGDIAVAGTLSGNVVTGTQVTVPAPVNNTDATSKKYVDDGDALKLNISDVNSYAVGLTGNQGPIAGVKTFANKVNGRGGFMIVDANDANLIDYYRSGNALYIRNHTTAGSNTFTELRLATTQSATEIKYSLIMLSYQDDNGTPALKDYHIIYEYTVSL